GVQTCALPISHPRVRNGACDNARAALAPETQDPFLRLDLMRPNTLLDQDAERGLRDDGEVCSRADRVDRSRHPLTRTDRLTSSGQGYLFSRVTGCGDQAGVERFGAPDDGGAHAI